MPFPTMPADIRARGEDRTGRTLEQSYSGLTARLAGVVDEWVLADGSRAARRRRMR